MIVGSNLANFITYIYHLIIGRLLEPEKYGDLAATISVLGLFTVSFAFFSLVIVKFISAAEKSNVEKIFSWFYKKAIILAFFLGIIVFIFSPLISKFIQVDYKIVVLIAPILVISVLTLVFRSVLQGLLRFKESVVSVNSEMFFRLILGVIFVKIGLSVFGAFLGILVAILISMLLTRFFLREFKIWSKDDKSVDAKGVFSYAAPILITSLATNSFFSTDVVLVKHFFESYQAGIYASLSTLGKIIFYGAGPVGSVMFPMISQRHSRGQNFQKIFLLSMLLTLGISGGVLVVYLFFPELAIKILYGNKYISAAPDLVWFGLFMTIFTIASLILNYFLSKRETKMVGVVLLSALIQAVGIWFFHDSILTVIKVSIAASSLFLITMLIYLRYEGKIKTV